MPGHDQPDANVALVNRFFRNVMNNENPQDAAQLLTQNFVVHHSMLPGGQGGAADVAQMMQGFRSSFPNLRYDVQDHVAQGDRVATRWLATADHTGAPFFGIPAKVPPVHVSVGGTDIFRIAGDRIAEAWVCSDMLSLLQQLGGFQPAPAAAAPAPAAAGH